MTLLSVERSVRVMEEVVMVKVFLARRCRRRVGCWCKRVLVAGLVAEFLATDGGFIHQASFVHGEHGDAVSELGIGPGAGLEGDGGSLGIEAEVTVFESVESVVGLEDDDFEN